MIFNIIIMATHYGMESPMQCQISDPTTFGVGLQYSLMRGPWLLAQARKRVQRPGGLELTRRMLNALDICTSDDVVELAPGVGVTARATLERRPRSYIGIEPSEDAARHVRWYLRGNSRQCLVGRAEKTGLPGASASVIYGESILTMQTAEQKTAIVAEAARVLRTGGRFGIHELSLKPDNLSPAIKSIIPQALFDAIHVGARPLTENGWCELLTAQGFRVEKQMRVPMQLLKLRQLVRDEGLPRALRIIWNAVTTPAVRRSVRAMYATFRRYAEHLCATAIVAVKT